MATQTPEGPQYDPGSLDRGLLGTPINDGPAPRETWVDTAKGMAILLVVLHHVQLLVADGWTSLPTAWWAVNDALLSFRMPGFFLLSGLFAARALRRPWAEYRRSKLDRLLWLYLVWTLVYALAQVVRAVLLGGGDPVGSVLRWLGISATVNTGLWYLVALAAFFLLWRGVGRAAPAPVLVLAGLSSVLVATGVVVTGSWGLDKILQYALYFLLGAWFGNGLRAAARRAGLAKGTWRGMGTGAALTLLWLLVFLVAWPVPALTPWREALLPLLAVPMFLWWSVVLAPTSLGHGLRRIGTVTLPLYVMHTMVAEFLVLVASLLLPLPPAALLWVSPLLLTAATVLLCLVVWGLTRRIPGLYSLPGDRFTLPTDRSR